MPSRRLLLAAALASPALAAPAAAARAAAHGGGPNGPGLLTLLPPDSVTRHALPIPGGTLDYTATVGTLTLLGQDAQKLAAIFFTAYVLKSDRPAARPVTFVFNGGPGAASAYLHLGLVGPKILDFGPEPDPARATLRDNPETWLRFTDLVLIDPVGTGWSRAASGTDAQQFWNVRGDVESLAKAAALWLARNAREASPVFLLGESYGGLRAAKLARGLLEQQGVAITGVTMLSPLIDSALTLSSRFLPLGAALQLPSLAAAALHRRGALTPPALAEAERFALGEYLTTLAGPPPQGEAARAFYGRIAALTGLPPAVVARTRGFIGHAYVKSLYAAREAVASPYDTDFAVPDPDPETAGTDSPDPVLDGFTRAYGGAFVRYAREALGFATPMTYQLLSAEVNRHWNWHGHGPVAGPAAGDDLRELFSLLPSFRLLVAHGMFDLETPYAASRWILEHLPDAGGRAALRLYPGGHMIYLTARSALTEDAAVFYQARNERLP